MLNVLGSFTGWSNFEPTALTSVMTELGALHTPTAVSGVIPFDAALTALAAIDMDLMFAGIDPSAAGLQLSFLGLLSSTFIFSKAMAALLAVKPAFTGLWIAHSHLGVASSSVSVVIAAWVWLLESTDIFLLIGELAIAGSLFMGLWLVVKRAGFRVHGYHDLVTLCQQRGISLAEVGSLLTLMLGFVLFDAFVTMAEDDALEAISYAFAAVVALAVILLALAVDIQYYYLISSISGGEQTLRLLYTDIVNNVLCLLRIFFCWVRYLFYDLQAELVDFSFHYTELAEEAMIGSGAALGNFSAGGMTLGWTGWAVFSGALLVILLDGVSLLLQLLIGAFKLALALFLFWLILDLFLLRTLARTEARWAQVRVLRSKLK